MNYATLTECREYLGLTTAETADDALLASLIVMACKDAEDISQRKFYPLIESRLFDVPDDPYCLLFGDDLLALTSIINGDATSISASSVTLIPARLYPKYEIDIKPSASITWVGEDDGDNQQAITITGTWGYHTDWPNAFVSSQDAIADVAGINATVASITVTDADGAAIDGRSPRFQVGQLIKIESEYLDVLTVNATSNVITVKRGANGSTAAIHATATAITIFRPIERVKKAVMKHVKWNYRQKDSDTFDKITVLGSTQTTTPGGTPPDFENMLPVRVAFP